MAAGITTKKHKVCNKDSDDDDVTIDCGTLDVAGIVYMMKPNTVLMFQQYVNLVFTLFLTGDFSILYASRLF